VTEWFDSPGTERDDFAAANVSAFAVAKTFHNLERNLAGTRKCRAWRRNWIV